MANLNIKNYHNSILSPFIRDYIRVKKGLGFKAERLEIGLWVFDTWAQNKGNQEIALPKELVDDYTNHFGSLPFDLLKIPNKYWENSRIYKQKAGLLLRDYVISQPKYEAYFISEGCPCHDFPYMTDLDFNLSHDLSDSYICETFVFKKDPDYAKLYLENKGITPSFIYDSDEDDLSHRLLSGWIESYYNDSHQYGTPIIDLSLHSSFNIDY